MPPPPAGGLSAAEVESGLKGLPGWIDPLRCAKMMTRRKCKSLIEAHSYHLMEQVHNLYHSGRYKNAFKACTALLKPTTTEDRPRGVTSKKGVISAQKAIDRINDRRLSKEAESIDFCEQIAELGVHIILTLPNGTLCTAEMDQLFEKFKPACTKSALRIALNKMKLRMDVRLERKKV